MEYGPWKLVSRGQWLRHNLYTIEYQTIRRQHFEGERYFTAYDSTSKTKTKFPLAEEAIKWCNQVATAMDKDYEYEELL